MTWSDAAAAAWTAMPDSLPVMDECVSVAVIDWVPAVSRVTEKVCVAVVGRDEGVEAGRRSAWGSVLVRSTVPV